jgi:NAD(P)-dependent dehydrogenase (short-subunit alcohol dehydrogenase family)
MSADRPAAEKLFDLSGKVALITGGSRGLGLEMARAFAAAGASVVIASRKQDACDAAARQVAEAVRPGVRGRGLPCRQLGRRRAPGGVRLWNGSGGWTCWSTTPACRRSTSP